ncbi:MAG: hypothetical protein ACM3SV_09570 [Betaproteobacteria bacterium]
MFLLLAWTIAMLRSALRLTFLASILITSPQVFADELSCDLVKKFKDGSKIGHLAKLTVDAEKITALFVSSFTASGKEGGAYFCNFDTARLESKPKWSVRGMLTSIAVRDGDQRSVVTVRKVGSSYVIDPSGISRYYCGFGAEWPDRISIEAAKKKCKVTPNP